MVESHGSTVPAGFSASVLFKRMSSSVRPVPAMIRAVDTLQQAGEMENNHSVTTLQEETSQSLQFLNHWRRFLCEIMFIGRDIHINNPNCFLHKFYQIAKVLPRKIVTI